LFPVIFKSMLKKKASIFEIEGLSYGRKFNLLGRLYLSALAKELKDLNLERHFSVLILIDKMGDQCCQKFIADALHIDKAMMVGVLDDLGKKGFVKRAQNPSDRREYWIQLTSKGKKSMPKIISAVNRLNKSIMKNVSKEEEKKLHSQLESIYESLLIFSNSV
jgi:MarR family transcriptional regulator, transcriptional regulator for hemolysin